MQAPLAAPGSQNIGQLLLLTLRMPSRLVLPVRLSVPPLNSPAQMGDLLLSNFQSGSLFIFFSPFLASWHFLTAINTPASSSFLSLFMEQTSKKSTWLVLCGRREWPGLACGSGDILLRNIIYETRLGASFFISGGAIFSLSYIWKEPRLSQNSDL